MQKKHLFIFITFLSLFCFSFFLLAIFSASFSLAATQNDVITVQVANSDSIPPTVPTNLTGTVISSSEIDLSWTSSTDNIAVVEYDIYRGGIFIASVLGTSTTYQNTGLSPATTYSYTVHALDPANNDSGASNTFTATTLAPPTPPPPAGPSSGTGPSAGGGGGFVTTTPGGEIPPEKVKLLKKCDLDGNGSCNIVDLSILLFHYGESGAGTARFDLNNDNTIDIIDISIFLYYWE